MTIDPAGLIGVAAAEAARKVVEPMRAFKGAQGAIECVELDALAERVHRQQVLVHARARLLTRPCPPLLRRQSGLLSVRFEALFSVSAFEWPLGVRGVCARGA